MLWRCMGRREVTAGDGAIVCPCRQLRSRNALDLRSEDSSRRMRKWMRRVGKRRRAARGNDEGVRSTAAAQYELWPIWQRSRNRRRSFCRVRTRISFFGFPAGTIAIFFLLSFLSSLPLSTHSFSSPIFFLSFYPLPFSLSLWLSFSLSFVFFLFLLQKKP